MSAHLRNPLTLQHIDDFYPYQCTDTIRNCMHLSWIYLNQNGRTHTQTDRWMWYENKLKTTKWKRENLLKSVHRRKLNRFQLPMSNSIKCVFCVWEHRCETAVSSVDRRHFGDSFSFQRLNFIDFLMLTQNACLDKLKWLFRGANSTIKCSLSISYFPFILRFRRTTLRVYIHSFIHSVLWNIYNSQTAHIIRFNIYLNEWILEFVRKFLCEKNRNSFETTHFSLLATEQEKDGKKKSFHMHFGGCSISIWICSNKSFVFSINFNA